LLKSVGFSAHKWRFLAWFLALLVHCQAFLNGGDNSCLVHRLLLVKAMRAAPPKPPAISPRVRISAEQCVGLLLLASVITAGVIEDWDDAIARFGRIAAIYFFLTVGFRLLGKRELSVMSPLELITLMLIPEIASSTLADDGPLLNALAGIGLLLGLVFFVSLLSARFKAVESLIEPPARVLVVDGRLCKEAMFTERITADELYAEMRKHGIADVSQVRWAILESGGDISFVPRKGELPADSPEHRRTL
jgi:uncharacterized membrane protein YcaP (DUF421 family)